MQSVIPNAFVCPISLQVMVDPVTLSSGHSYERSSIIRWFDEGHNTCPVTMNQLQNQVLIPNLALQRLIQDWFISWIERNNSSADFLDNFESAVPVPVQIKFLMADLQKDKPPNRSTIVAIRRLVQHAGAIHISAEVIQVLIAIIVGEKQADKQCFLSSLGALALLPLEEHQKRRIIQSRPFQAVCMMLHSGNFKKSLYAAEFLANLAESAELRHELATTNGFLRGLLNLMSENVPINLQVPTMKALNMVCMCAKNRQLAIEEGAVKVLINCLKRRRIENSTELILQTLESLCSVAEGRAALVKEDSAIAMILKLLNHTSEQATGFVVGIFSSVLQADPQHIAPAALQFKAIPQFLLVLQRDCSPQIKSKTIHVLKILRGSLEEFDHLFPEKSSYTIL